MKQINFKDFKVIPILSSIKRIDMSDEEYFSKTYRNYVSNSRLKNINPIEGGSPSLYKNPPHFSTQSLIVGSAVHERLLQPESFELAPNLVLNLVHVLMLQLNLEKRVIQFMTLL